MPAAEVPGSESPKAETGQSTKVVGGVGRNVSNRIAITALSLASMGGLLILGGCSSSATKISICAKGSPTLTPVTGSTGSTLPPSHDNDTGRGHLRDSHPDADVDASQLPNGGRCQKS